jgi:hypothetical protein
MISRLARRRLSGVLLAAVFHVGLVALLIWSLRSPIVGSGERAVEVVLIPPTTTPAVRTPALAVPGRRRSAGGPKPPLAVSPPLGAGQAPAPWRPSSPGSAAPPALADAVRAALRSRLGCASANLFGLSPEERRRCQEVAAAAARVAPPIALDLDPRGLYALDPDAEPYLVRKPKKGCKPMAAGDQAPVGASGAAAGISCAVPF